MLIDESWYAEIYENYIREKLSNPIFMQDEL